MTDYKGDNEVGYLRLPDHPGGGVSGCVAKTVRLSDIVVDHKGPDVFLDYDESGVLVGIELLFE
jgi:uncharacterized protein YuzE